MDQKVAGQTTPKAPLQVCHLILFHLSLSTIKYFKGGRGALGTSVADRLHLLKHKFQLNNKENHSIFINKVILSMLNYCSKS